MYRKTIGEPQRYLAKKLHRRRSEFRSEYRRWIIGVVSSIVLVILIWVITTSIVYAPRYDIASVSVAHGPSSSADEQTVTQYIQQVVGSHRSYLALRGRQRDGDRAMIQDTFPLIESVELASFDTNTVTIDVQYRQPRIVRHLPSGAEFGSYDEYLYPLAEDYTIGSGTALLYLPSYLPDIQTLDGIYHETAESELASVYHTVNQKIPLKHMIVYPGAGYVAMKTVDDLKILFSLRKPIENQMELYSAIYQYYPEAYRIRQIDVGSLDDAIVTLE